MRFLKSKLLHSVVYLILGLLVLASSLSVCSAQSQTFAYVNITGGWATSENITIAENNWVNLQGGTEVTIPQLTFVYNGFNQTNYTKDSRTINITVNVSENTDHTVSYPNTTHQLFYNDSTVAISFNTTVSGTAYYYVAKTYPTQMRDIFQAIVDGNTTTFRDLFFNNSAHNGTVNLPNAVSISNPVAGDYVLVLTDNPLSASNFTIISTTFIEVLEYKSTLAAPTSIDQNADLDVTMNITGASSDLQYRYGGALIKKSVYEQAREIKLMSNASEAGSNLTFGDASLIENWNILGVGLGNVGATKAQDTINNLFGANNGTVTFIDPTNSVSKVISFGTLEDLPIGTYTLLVGVWQGNDRLVAFNQTEVKIEVPKFAQVNITGGWATSENIGIAENNWVNLQGGTEVTIPQLTFVYNGFNQTNYTKDGGNRTINITVDVSENTDHTVSYPNTTHQLFYNDSTVAISFNTTVSGTAYYYVAKTYPTQMRDICQAIVDGNTTTFRDLFFNNSAHNGTVNLPGGTATINPVAGDYVLVLTDNPLNASNFTLISTTFIEVLEYKSTLTAPTSIDQNADLDVTMNITGASSDLQYRYGGALIKKSVYEQAREIKLISNASEAGSNLTFGDASLIENWNILGVGLGNVGATKAQDTINNLFGANNGTVTFIDPTNSVSKVISFGTLEDLPIGTYTLLVGVWQGNDRLVAFNQTDIDIEAEEVTPSAPSGVGGGAAAAPVMSVPVNPETGAVTSTTTLTVAKATLTIHEGIIVKDAAGNPLSTSITMLHTPSTAKNIGAITAYNFGPSGTTFSKPIDLVIAYDPAEIPAGFREADLVVKMYDGTIAKWIDLDTTVDTVAHTATAKVSHFTVFALFAEKAVIPPTTPSPTPTVTPTPPVPISPVLPSAKPPWALIIVGIIAVVIAVGAVVYYYYYYKKRGST